MPSRVPSSSDLSRDAFRAVKDGVPIDFDIAGTDVDAERARVRVGRGTGEGGSQGCSQSGGEQQGTGLHSGLSRCDGRGVEDETGRTETRLDFL